MVASTLTASLLVFPEPLHGSYQGLDQVSEAKSSNVSFAIYLTEPHVITLHQAGASRDSSIKGLLHFPDFDRESPCFEAAFPAGTRIHDGLGSSEYAAIAFAPWNPSCNRQYLDAARDDHSNIEGFLFYSPDRMEAIPASTDTYWEGGYFKDYEFPIFAIPGREGLKLNGYYLDYSNSNRTVVDINDTPGRGKVYIDFNLGSRAPLPGLWLFLLIVLAALILIVGLTSLSMHLLQWRRRRALRRRVASGEVDLEALGIKRLLVPRKILEKIPLRTYVATTSTTSTPSPRASSSCSAHSFAPPSPPLPPDPTFQPRTRNIAPELPPNSAVYDQPSCSICLEDFVSHATTVRELPCRHIFHPACIDSFLEAQSSLCPLCKKSALPKGYVPPNLTNATVRRERNFRRRQERQTGIGRNRWLRLLLGGRPVSPEGHEMGNGRDHTRSRRRSAGGGEYSAGRRRRGKWRRVVSAVFPGFR